MSVTVESIFIKSLALIDELLTTGAYDSNKVADYKGRTPALVDMIQKELYRTGDLSSQYEISRYPITNMLGDQYNVEEYTAVEDKTYEAVNDSNGSVKAYYFESDSNNGAVYIEDYTSAWNTLATINLTNTGIGFVTYKGLVTPTTGATKSRIRFSGSYYYKTVNRALFNYNFEFGKSPDYMAWVRIALPTDVKSIEKVVLEYPNQNYSYDAYKIETVGNRQYLYVAYSFDGKIRVQYKPVPTTITANTDTLLIDDVTAQCIAYKLASIFMASEQNEYLASVFMEQFNQLKAESSIKQPTGEVGIIDYYGTTF
jgi:hypothetical protein